MSDSWLKRAVMSAVVLLVLHAVGAWAYAALGVAAAIVAAALVCAVSVFTARMALRGNDAWFLVPTAIFTALPLAARVWTFLSAQQRWWERTVELAPFLIGFAAPVCLLLAAYLELGRRARRLAPAMPGP